MDIKTSLAAPKVAEKTKVLPTLTLSKEKVLSDETFGMTVRFSVVGELRDVFVQEKWEEAYDAGDKGFRVYYDFEVLKSGVFPVGRKSIYSAEVKRKTTLYWIRNPDLPYRIWALVTDEFREPHLPKNVKEAQAFVFEVEKTTTIPASELGKGNHKLIAKAKARWGKHVYAERGSVVGSSKPVNIEII